MGILNDALGYVGKIDYVFGVNDIDGGRGDCSAFTQHIYKTYGYNIGRDTLSQLQWCKSNATEVSKNNIKPGDIVFFQGTYREGVSHVGIAAGNGFMINLQSDGVLYEKYNSGYWNKHFMTAYRFADSEDIGSLYVDSEMEENIIGSNTGNMVERWGLSWWADIMVIIIVLACIGFSLFFFVKAFGVNLKKSVGISATEVIETVEAEIIGGRK